MKAFYKYLVIVVGMLAACEDPGGEVKSDQGLDYYPLRTGMYWIYHVTGTQYTFSSPEDFEYEMKVEVTDSFPNGAGGYTYIVYRSTRPVSGGAWSFLDTWSVRKDAREAIVTEGNVPYVKLIFPLSRGIAWDGNERNGYGSDEYMVVAMDQPLTVGSVPFENTLTVELESYDDQVTRADVRSEVFARNVGMVSKNTKQVTYCTDVVCAGDRIIASGIVFEQVIKEYGIQ